MAKKRKSIKRKSEPNLWFKAWLIFLSIISSIALFFIFRKIMNSEKHLISLTIIPIILGITFELKRLNVNWKNIITNLVLGLSSSIVLSFIPGKKEYVYKTDFHIQIFPFVFTFMFLLFSIIYFIKQKEQEKLSAQLTEGILSIQSISIIYLIIDIVDFNNINIFKKILILFGLVFCFFSFFHAFTYYKHSKFTKLSLSLWSSIISLIFGIVYIIRVFKFEISENYDLSENFVTFLQYFLLGTSAIYVLRNAYFIFGFLPSKNESNYTARIKELKSIHVNRFSENQIHIFSSLLCLFFVGGIYYLNHFYHWMPSYTMIWLVFTFFPVIIYYFEKFTLTENQIQEKI